ncbi:MAG: hypothetical protein IJ511_11035 [Bacteroides sp.]|nr:hypothetical protein [Bacteroides sp.]
MERRTSSYSINRTLGLILFLCLLLGQPLSAQVSGGSPSQGNTPRKAEKKEKVQEVPEAPLYNGLSVGLDLWGLGGKVLGSDFLSTEVSVSANLKNRYFPIVELGYGTTDAWNDKGTNYKTSAPYFRIGMDYNTLYNKAHGHMLLVGLRYAATSFKYDVMALDINDPIYGGSVGNPNLEDDIWGGSQPFNHKGMKGSMQWIEFCVGIRAHIWQNLYMGWAMRFKFKTSATTGQYGDPWYVPGFGKYASNKLGVSYTITYKLPY